VGDAGGELAAPHAKDRDGIIIETGERGGGVVAGVWGWGPSGVGGGVSSSSGAGREGRLATVAVRVRRGDGTRGVAAEACIAPETLRERCMRGLADTRAGTGGGGGSTMLSSGTGTSTTKWSAPPAGAATSAAAARRSQ
jgi:hypothetical protein